MGGIVIKFFQMRPDLADFSGRQTGQFFLIIVEESLRFTVSVDDEAVKRTQYRCNDAFVNRRILLHRRYRISRQMELQS